MLQTIEEVDYFSRGQNQDKLGFFDTVKLEYLFVSMAIGYKYILYKHPRQQTQGDKMIAATVATNNLILAMAGCKTWLLFNEAFIEHP